MSVSTVTAGDSSLSKIVCEDVIVAVSELSSSGEIIAISEIGFSGIKGDTGASGGIAYIDSTDSAGIYGVLSGVVDGVNKDFTVAQGSYVAGKLKVTVQGQVQSGNYFSELDPANGVFRLTNPPAATLDIMAEYTT